jgi:hypothetical protein
VGQSFTSASSCAAGLGDLPTAPRFRHAADAVHHWMNSATRRDPAALPLCRYRWDRVDNLGRHTPGMRPGVLLSRKLQVWLRAVLSARPKSRRRACFRKLLGEFFGGVVLTAQPGDDRSHAHLDQFAGNACGEAIELNGRRARRRRSGWSVRCGSN